MSKRDEFIDRAAKKIHAQLGENTLHSFESIRYSVEKGVDLAVEINALINDFQDRTDCGDMAPQIALALKHSTHTGIFDKDYPHYSIGDSIANMEGAWSELLTLLNAHYENNLDEAFEDEQA